MPPFVFEFIRQLITPIVIDVVKEIIKKREEDPEFKKKFDSLKEEDLKDAKSRLDAAKTLQDLIKRS